MLPLRARLIHCRWSGESTWIPFGDFRPGVDYEHHTSHPAPGQLALYPGGISECEIFFPYGACTTSSKVGQLAANHFATIAARRRLGGPAARGRPALPVGGRPGDRDRRARLTRAVTDRPARPRRHGRHRDRARARADVAIEGGRIAAIEAGLWRARRLGARGRRRDRAAGAAGRHRRPHPHPRRQRRRARPVLPGLGRGGVRRHDDVPGVQQPGHRRRRAAAARSLLRRPAASGARRPTSDSAVDVGLSLVVTSAPGRPDRRAAAASSTPACRRSRRSWSTTSASTTPRSCALLGAAAGAGGMLEVHCENRTILDALTARHLAAGETGPRVPRRVAAAVRRGRGDRPGHRAGAGGRGAAVRRAPLVRRGAGRRFARRRRRRPAGVRRDLPALPDADRRRATTLPPEEAARYVISPPLRAAGQSRGAVGRPGRRRARARRRPTTCRIGSRSRSSRWRESFDRISNGGPGHRDAAGDGLRRRRGRGAGSASSGMVDAPGDDAGAAVRPARRRARSRSGATRTSCCSIPGPGARVRASRPPPHERLHARTRAARSGGRCARRSSAARSSSATARSSAPRGHGRFVERALGADALGPRRSVEAAVRLERQELGEVVGQDEPVEQRGGLADAGPCRARSGRAPRRGSPA